MNHYNKKAFEGIKSIPKDELERAKIFYGDEFHSGWSNFSKTHKFKLINFFKHIASKYTILKEGFFVMLGSSDCEVLDCWCDLFGSKRVIGYDIVNPNSHPNVRIQDIRTLSVESIASAFVWNDCGYWFLTPQANLAGLKFAVKNVIIGGFYLSFSAYVSGINLTPLLKKEGFIVVFEHAHRTLYKRIREP